MQAVFYERENRFSASQEREETRTDSKVITRRQDRRSGNMFKKKNEEEENLSRDRRSQSSHLIKFVKHQSASQRDDVPTGNQAFQNPNPNPKESNPNFPSKSTPKKSLVFNKFTHRHKEEIRDHMTSLKHAIDNQSSLHNTNQIFLQIQAYISKMEDNNTKLLEVNYFFQKEFNELMAEKQLAKRMEKCSKNYCLECRYHLEKENKWKQEKIELQSQITKLKDELSSVQNSKVEDSSKNVSISQHSVDEQEIMRQSILKMREQLQEKDQQYLILLKEFNYLDSINKNLKQKLAKIMEEYKYLSIENRTLLNMKTKVIEKQLECTRYKEERDYFKKKMIYNHRKSEAELRASCKCAINKGDESIFSLSSVSNDLQERNTSSIIYMEELPLHNTTQFS